MTFTKEELYEKETIRTGVYGDLKEETDKKRIWIDKNGVITEEVYIDGKWEIF